MKGFAERLKIKWNYSYIPDKIKECPRCGGTRNPTHPGCWHCIKCDFAACAYTYKEFKQIKKKYFNIVHPAGRGIKIGKSLIDWWINWRHTWTFFFSFSCWVEEEDNGLKYAHGNIHVLCFCMNFTYWGWPVRAFNWQPAEKEGEGET